MAKWLSSVAARQPYFTTDTGAALRAAELDCHLLLKATQVDGVYSADPKKDPSAKRFDRLTHDEAIRLDLKVMDTAAFALAREAGLTIAVFSMRGRGSWPLFCAARAARPTSCHEARVRVRERRA